MILYPTETLYALGVNALDTEELSKLYKLKGRDSTKVASWLVRNVEDIEEYAVMGEVATKIAKRFLPGQLTLVLKVREGIPAEVVAPDCTIGFRISADPMAKQIIAAFMEEYKAPLTCTSANVSGSSTYSMTGEILQQFGERAHMIDEVHDDGPRNGLASTVVRVIGNELTVLREGEISEEDIMAYLAS
jgi:L-threonylcarbamoyladenylate synthase